MFYRVSETVAELGELTVYPLPDLIVIVAFLAFLGPFVTLSITVAEFAPAGIVTFPDAPLKVYCVPWLAVPLIEYLTMTAEVGAVEAVKAKVADWPV